jgi:dihydroneopterin aldolase
VKRAVVKIGGSTANEKVLDTWVSALAGSRLPLIIVPGGGPFADEVREAQRLIGFSDRAAHAMAILAMEQFGHLILDRDARLVPARSLEEMEQGLSAPATLVWLPSSLAVPADDIPASWDVTSDSLAAWLAGQLGADALLLVKQTSDFSAADDVESLTARGIVDPSFGKLLPPDVDFRLVGPEDAAAVAAALSSGRLPGLRVARKAAGAGKAG